MNLDNLLTAEEVIQTLRAGVEAIGLNVSLLDAFRAAKEYAQADKLRKTMESWGLEIRQGKDGSAWYLADPNPEATKRFNAWLASMRAEKDRREGA